MSMRKRKLALKRWHFGKSRYYYAIRLQRQYTEDAILFYNPRQFGKTSLANFIAYASIK